MNSFSVTIIIGSLVSLALAGYAFSLWRKVWRHQRQLAENKESNRKKFTTDLKILTNSLLNDEQGHWVELCIRIKVMLEHYDYELSQNEDYRVFQLIYQVCENIPTHQAWKDLPRSERRSYEAGFATLEQEHKSSSHQAALKLQQLLEQ